MTLPLDRPALSIVIATHNATDVLTACLTALQAQADAAEDLEIIVADSSTDGTFSAICDRFPKVNSLHFEAPLTLSQLRGKGIAIATGNLIAILDPYSIADPSWSAALISAHHQHPNWVIGGVVNLFEASQQSLLTWAIYINEYGMFMPPLEAGVMEILPGSNISYKRHVLFNGDQPKQQEFWKTFVNQDTEHQGAELWLAPSVCVSLKKDIPFWKFWRSRFDHGRCFAGMRSAQISWPERCLRAFTAPLLPAVFLWRWGRRYWAKKRYRSKFLITLPLQILLFGNWALGECVGYCFGSGKSCQRLFY